MENICDWKNCKEKGEFRAPIEKDNSKKFRLLCKNHIKKFTIQHYDLFRLKNRNEIANIGLFENYNDVLILIEWPEKIIDKPKGRYDFYFKYENKTEKRFLSVYKDNIK